MKRDMDWQRKNSKEVGGGRRTILKSGIERQERDWEEKHV